MTTVQPLAVFQPTPETPPDPGAQAEVAQSAVFGSLLRSVGARRGEAPTDAPVTRQSRAALAERGGGVKDLRLSDAAKLDYGSMAALELASPGPAPAPTEPDAPSEPQARAGRGREGTQPNERSPAHARGGGGGGGELRESRAESAGPAGTSEPVGQAAGAQPVSPASGASAAHTAFVATGAIGGQLARVGGRPVSGAAGGATTPAPGARSEGVRVPHAGGGPGQARATAQRLLGKLEGAAREAREPSPHVRQVARALLAAVRHGQGDISLRLLPEALGRVTVRLSMADESVSASFLPETESARQLLDASRDQLRAALEARGLRVERLEIDPSRVEPAGTAGPEAGPRADTGRHEGGAGGEDRAGAERTPGESGGACELELEIPVDVSWIDGVRGRVDTLA